MTPWPRRPRSPRSGCSRTRSASPCACGRTCRRRVKDEGIEIGRNEQSGPLAGYLPAQDRRAGDGERQNPHNQNHHQSQALRSPPPRVVQRLRHRQVPARRRGSWFRLTLLAIYLRTHLSMLMAHRLKIDAVHSRTSREIQMLHTIHPSCQEPANAKKILFNLICKHWKRAELSDSSG